MAQEDHLSDELHDLLQRGDYQQALTAAQQQLKQQDLRDYQRYELWHFISNVEYQRAVVHDFDDTEALLHALDVLKKEFYHRVDMLEWLSRMGELYWRQGDYKKARHYYRLFLQRSPKLKQARKVTLLLARLYLEDHQLSQAQSYLARVDLLGYEHRQQEALKTFLFGALLMQQGHQQKGFASMQAAWAMSEQAIRGDDYVFSLWLQANHGRMERAVLRRLLEDFLAHYRQGPYVPSINLLYADVLFAEQQWQKSQLVYAVLADRYPHSSVGRLAFIRGLMVEYREKTSLAELQPVIAAIRRLEVAHQMTDIAVEAQYAQARLYQRLLPEKPELAVKALLYSAFVVSAVNAYLHDQGDALGRQVFSSTIRRYLDAQEFLKAVALWRRFHMFVPKASQQTELFLQMVRCYIALGNDLDAEKMLIEVRHAVTSDLWKDRFMLEQAKIWRLRAHGEGISLLLQWMLKHESSLYLPEFTLILAQMYMSEHDQANAFQTFKHIDHTQLATTSLRDYYVLKGELFTTLKRWNIAAIAWAQRAEIAKDQKPWRILQARALFETEAYAAALQWYEQWPNSELEEKSRYRKALCFLYTGQKKQGEQLLQQLVADPKAGFYRSLSSLALSRLEADALIKVMVLE